MKLSKNESELYVFDGMPIADAAARTTHLAISAHQDDVEFMAYHGIVECFAKKDKAFSAVIVTNGSGSPRAGVYSDYTDQQMIEVRKKEQRKAAFIGEYALLAMLMHPSSAVKDAKNTAVVDDIFNILMATRPSVVYTHNLADKHDTHVSVALRVISAIRKMPIESRPQLVYGCEVWRDLDWLDDDKKIKLDVGEKQNLAASLMGVFDSQISGGKQYDLATTGRRLANATYADDHAVDTYTHVTYAMNLTPLAKDDTLTPAKLLESYLSAFTQSCLEKINKY